MLLTVPIAQVLAALAPMVSTAPTIRDDPKPENNTANCLISAQETVSDYTWTIQIGQPFLDGVGCAAIGKTLGDIRNYRCEGQNGNTTTLLSFATFDHRKIDDVTTCLHQAFPMIPFDAEKTCTENF